MSRTTTIIDEPWEQSWVLRMQVPGTRAKYHEIPMDRDQYPDPAVWKRVARPRSDAGDYARVVVDSRVCRFYSDSTKTWYEAEQEPYSPTIIDPGPTAESVRVRRAVQAVNRAVELVPIRDEDRVPTPGFSSLEDFFKS